MKLVCISDTHGLHKEMKYSIPYGDILIHAGDSLRTGSKSDLIDFINWFSNLPHKYKILIPGNHDFYLGELKRENILDILYRFNIHLLINNFVYINGLKFYGSPYSNRFGNWAFMEEESELEKVWARIPDNTDILITHGSSANCLNLDLTMNGEFAGSESLYKRKQELKNLKYHIFGHIHEAQGITHNKYKPSNYIDINASICNFNYEPIHKPITVNI